MKNWLIFFVIIALAQLCTVQSEEIVNKAKEFLESWSLLLFCSFNIQLKIFRSNVSYETHLFRAFLLSIKHIQSNMKRHILKEQQPTKLY